MTEQPRSGGVEPSDGWSGMLRQAVSNDAIEVHFQPVIDLTNGATVRMEALARWPGAGPLVGPEKFVRAAERAGWVAEFDLHVLRLVARQIAIWTSSGLDPAVSVNFSTGTLADERTVQRAVDILERFRVDPSSIHIEVAEWSRARTPWLQGNLERFRRAGFCISLEDFGTPDPFFHQLRTSSADELKIDHDHVAQLAESTGNTVVGSIIELAHVLGVAVVAEGVETEQEVRYLIELGCDFAQGRWFSPAVPADAAYRLFAVTHELPVS